MITVQVKFDAAELRAFEGTFGERGSDRVKMLIARSTYARWRELAGEELTSSRDAYLEGLQPPKVEHRRVKIVLIGGFANIIENGTRGFDMRRTMLKGRKFVVIPMRHVGPGGSGVKGTPMGAAYRKAYTEDKYARALGNRVYKLAKQLGPNERLPVGAGGSFPLEDHHKTDTFAGMVREQLGKKIQYTTFRTLSKDSEPSAWWYPAKSGRHLAKQVADETPIIVDRIFRQMLAGMRGK